MATIRFRDVTKTAALTAILNELDSGTSPVNIQIYTGSIPASPEPAIGAQVLLAELVCSDPVGTITGTGATLKLAFGTITQDTAANATGTAGFARVCAMSGASATPIFDCDVTATGGGGTLQLNTTSIVELGPVLITAFSLAIP